jgi:hypothetical protein
MNCNSLYTLYGASSLMISEDDSTVVCMDYLLLISVEKQDELKHSGQADPIIDYYYYAS